MNSRVLSCFYMVKRDTAHKVFDTNPYALSRNQWQMVFFGGLTMNIVDLDIRHTSHVKVCPMRLILQTAEDLRGDQLLQLHTLLKPISLCHVMVKRGFLYCTLQIGENHFVTQFYKSNLGNHVFFIDTQNTGDRLMQPIYDFFIAAQRDKGHPTLLIQLHGNLSTFTMYLERALFDQSFTFRLTENKTADGVATWILIQPEPEEARL